MLSRSRRRIERQSAVVPAVNSRSAPGAACGTKPLKFLSFNIQSGITTTRYRHYVTRGWKHVLPHVDRGNNLRQIADLVADFDFVALQEVDAGSLRSGFVNQVEYLADRAHFPYWYAQLNRDLGLFAQHGNGLLCRLTPNSMEDHKLPGRIPGRGAIVVRLPFGSQELFVVVLHLSLGERSRRMQLQYVRRLIEFEEHVVVLGDLNSHLGKLLNDSPLAHCHLKSPGQAKPTYPSWRPSLALDHVLVSPGLEFSQYEVLDCHLSDHRPIAVSIQSAA